MSEIVLSETRVDPDPEFPEDGGYTEQRYAVVEPDRIVVGHRTKWDCDDRWWISPDMGSHFTWPEIRRLAALDPAASGITATLRFIAAWSSVDDPHLDAMRMQEMARDAIRGEPDEDVMEWAALDPGTDRLRQVVSEVAEVLSDADCGGNMGVALTMSQCSEKLRMALGWREDEFGNFGPPLDPGTEGGGE